MKQFFIVEQPHNLEHCPQQDKSGQKNQKFCNLVEQACDARPYGSQIIMENSLTQDM